MDYDFLEDSVVGCKKFGYINYIKKIWYRDIEIWYRDNKWLFKFMVLSLYIVKL